MALKESSNWNRGLQGTQVTMTLPRRIAEGLVVAAVDIYVAEEADAGYPVNLDRKP